MRRLEYTSDTSNKFWEVTVDANQVLTRWGRVGTRGQSKMKLCGSPAEAEKEADKQARGKIRKGYVEVDAQSAAPTTAATPKAPVATPSTSAAPASPPAAPAVKAPAKATPAPAAEFTAPVDRRPAVEAGPSVVEQFEEAEVLTGFMAERDQLMAAERVMRMENHWQDQPNHARALTLSGEARGNLVAEWLRLWSRPQGHSTADADSLKAFYGRVIEAKFGHYKSVDKKLLTFKLSEDALRVCADALSRSPTVATTFELHPVFRTMAKAVRAKTPEYIKEEVRHASRAVRSAGDIKGANYLAAKLPVVGVDPHSGLDLDFGSGMRLVGRESAFRQPLPTVEQAWAVWSDGRNERWSWVREVVHNGLKLRKLEERPTTLSDLDCQSAIVLNPRAGVDFVCLTMGVHAALRALAIIERDHVLVLKRDGLNVLAGELETARDRFIPAWRSSWSAAYDRLKEHLVGLDSDAYDAFIAEARELATASLLRVRVAFALLTGHTQDCSDLEFALSPQTPATLEAWWVELETLTPKQALTIGVASDAVAVFVGRFGAAGVRALMAQSRAASKHIFEPVLQAASALPELQAARFLVLQTPPARHRAVLVPYLKRWPDLALVVLSEQPSLPRVLQDHFDKLAGAAPKKAAAASAKKQTVPTVLSDRPWAKRLPKAPPIDTTGWDMLFAARDDDPPVIRGTKERGAEPSSPASRYSSFSRTRLSVAQLLDYRDDADVLRLFDNGSGLVYNANGSDAEWLSLAKRTGIQQYALGWFSNMGHSFPASLLARIESPYVAVRLSGGKQRDWATLHPVLAVKGWLWGMQLKTAEKKRHLASLVAFNHVNPQAVATAAEQLGPKMVTYVQAVLERCPSGTFPPPARKVPSWVPTDLPAPVHADTGEETPRQAVTWLLENLASTPKDGTPWGLDTLRETYTEASLNDFVWGLFLAWDREGAKTKEGWAMDAVGHFGTNELVERYAEFVRGLLRAGRHQAAPRALEVFERIGTDRALARMHRIGSKAKYGSVRHAVEDSIQKIAKRRGLTDEQLKDRLVPTLDLDADGSRTLDFGPRSFRVGFDEHLVPFVVDVATGKSRKSLPKAAMKDDAVKAASANETWKLLKKLAKQAAKDQLARLEDAMVTGRRWSAADFQALLVNHPLMFNLVRRLLWGVYDGDTCTATFRVGEDRTLADVDDDTFSLPEGAVVGLPYCPNLEPAVVAGWTEVWSDYELIQPFDQLHRRVFELTDEERSSGNVLRFEGRVIPYRRLQALLSRGWEYEDGWRHGTVQAYFRRVKGGPIAEVRFEPGIETRGGYSGEQTLGIVTVHGGGDQMRTVSELLRDIEWVSGTTG